jgi:DNA ligase-1
MSTRPLAHQVVPGADGAESATAEDGAVRPRDSLFHWCGTVDALRETDDASERQAALQAYFVSVADETIAPAARFFTGALTPQNGETTRSINDDVVIAAMQELARVDADDLRERSARAEDLGCMAGELFAGRLPSGLSMREVASWGEKLERETSEPRQRALVRDMLARLSSLEARYLVNLINGRLGLGIREAEIEEALSRAFGLPLASIRAALTSGHDIGEVARLARRRAIA